MKYRVWDKGNNEWITDCDLYMFPDGSVYAGDMGNLPLFKIKSKYVSFSTGLKDKNGVEIYSGDIVSKYHKGIQFDTENHEIMVVEWSDFGWSPFINEIGRNCQDDVGKLFECVVVGNIYENKQLIIK